MEKRSIKKAVLIVCMTLACCMAAAQADTLENLCIPNFFHNWCDENPTANVVHDGRDCVILPKGLASDVYDSSELSAAVYPWTRYYEVAVQMRPDTMLHVTGIAFGRTGYNLHLLTEYQGFTHLYDSATVSRMECHFNVYDSNLSLVATKAVRYTDISPTLYFPIMHEIPGAGINRPGYDALYEVFFDTVLDMTGPFYISETITVDDNPYYADTYSAMEFHNHYAQYLYQEPFRISNERVVYRDTLVTGHWLGHNTYDHYSMILFPIIRNDGDTCPQVCNIEVFRGNTTQFFMRWERGTNHYDWQVSYGPAGTAPDDGTMLTFNQPMSSLITVDPDSHYVAYVRARCRFARDEWGPWSDPVDIHLNANDIETADSGVPVTLSPNPATASVTVACGEPMLGVELLDLDGRILLEQQPSGTYNTTLDTSTIPTGTYLLLIHTPQGTAVKKLVVRR